MKFDRHRRLRSSKTMRDLVRETHVRKEDLIYPIFVVEQDDIKSEIKSLPGIYQISLNLLHEEIKEAYDLGIRAIMFFGVPNDKDDIDLVHMIIMELFKKRHEYLRIYIRIYLLLQILVFVNTQTTDTVALLTIIRMM